MNHLFTDLGNGQTKTQNKAYFICLVAFIAVVAIAHFFFGLNFKIN